MTPTVPSRTALLYSRTHVALRAPFSSLVRISKGFSSRAGVVVSGKTMAEIGKYTNAELPSTPNRLRPRDTRLSLERLRPGVQASPCYDVPREPSDRGGRACTRTHPRDAPCRHGRVDYLTVAAKSRRSTARQHLGTADYDANRCARPWPAS